MRLIDADALKNLPFERMIHTDFGETAIPIEEIDMAPTVNPSLNFDNITEEDIENFKMIWQRATSKGLPIINTVNCKDCDGYEAGYSAGVRDTVKVEVTEVHTFAKPDDVSDIKFGDEE